MLAISLAWVFLSSPTIAEQASDTAGEPFPDASAVYLEKEHDWRLKPWKSRVSSYKNRLLIRDRRGLGQADQAMKVVCLENDSPDAMALADDAAELAPGQGFFYLYRGDPGDLVGPGSWGQGSNGAERVPADGSCPSTP